MSDLDKKLDGILLRPAAWQYDDYQRAKQQTKHCLACNVELRKKPKQSYEQWDRQKYCSHVCSAIGPNKLESTAKDRSNLHKFWRRRIPEPQVCELCREQRKLALSNRSQDYLNVITDWWYLCYSCHGRYDAIGFKVWETRRQHAG